MKRSQSIKQDHSPIAPPRSHWQRQVVLPSHWQWLFTLLGLGVSYLVHFFLLFVIGVGHMRPGLPGWFTLASLLLQLIPLAAAALVSLALLWSWQRRHVWLWLTLFGWVCLSLPIFAELARQYGRTVGQ
ncbi:hypothetical protein [Chitinibacter tainanensis]|uniref:hypothetical protein n=1 Tax=Chitinibacter tainanensis TaxID=230667 RepID=UPI00049200AC|nr:hypothetical protein [Chitinibacter tainanensis]